MLLCQGFGLEGVAKEGNRDLLGGHFRAEEEAPDPASGEIPGEIHGKDRLPDLRICREDVDVARAEHPDQAGQGA